MVDRIDSLIKIYKTLENESSDNSVNELTEGRQYLKGNYCAHCSIMVVKVLLTTASNMHCLMKKCQKIIIKIKMSIK